MKRHVATFLLATTLLTTSAFAQARGGNAVKSPEVAADGKVTFRINAPKATEVTMTGEWLPPNAHTPLVKDDKGIWSVTLDMVPGFSIYSFTVDGVAMADPVNPRMKIRATTSASIVEVPGDGKQLWEIQDVPHGKVELNYMPSKVLNGQTREVRVYTPPGYAENNAAKYPVMYLLHGNNDTQQGWTDVGRANYILDNLIAQKKAVPMVVVMPFGHAVPYGGQNNNTVFEKYLLEDVMPAAEKEYRITADREHRAIVGYSMGGEQALSIGLAHVDLFSAIGALSPSVPRNMDTQFKALWDDPAGTNAKIKTFFLACGKLDSSHYGSTESFDALLKTHQITHTFMPSEGYHDFINWRLYLGEMTPMLFHDAK